MARRPCRGGDIGSSECRPRCGRRRAPCRTGQLSGTCGSAISPLQSSPASIKRCSRWHHRSCRPAWPANISTSDVTREREWSGYLNAVWGRSHSSRTAAEYCAEFPNIPVREVRAAECGRRSLSCPHPGGTSCISSHYHTNTLHSGPMVALARLPPSRGASSDPTPQFSTLNYAALALCAAHRFFSAPLMALSAAAESLRLGLRDRPPGLQTAPLIWQLEGSAVVHAVFRTGLPARGRHPGWRRLRR